MKSELRVGGNVSFPEFTGERVYMLPFLKRDGLPKNLARWQPTVDSMLCGVSTDGPIYLMIDQGVIQAGATHRRPGLHVDGNWIPALQCHGGSGTPAGHGHTVPSPVSYPVRESEEKPKPPSRDPDYNQNTLSYRDELIVLASDVSACRVITGDFEGVPAFDGDCAHINVRDGCETILETGRVYYGNVTMLHESLSIPASCKRTLVRLNVPGVR